MAGQQAVARSWLMLVHQLPREPPGVRVRIWRRLQAIGALPLKSSVYLLPESDETREDFEWLVREIGAAGAAASLLRSSLLAGTTDEECVTRFRAAATAEYDAMRAELRELEPQRRRKGSSAATGAERERRIAKLRERLRGVERRDFFGADGREAVAGMLTALESRTKEAPLVGSRSQRALPALSGKTWVTRADVRVDRMASAWLVRRFVDRKARFRFVTPSRYEPAAGEVRFDMFGGEFTHEGQACTFEVLVAKRRLREPGLRKLGEIVHDLDMKEERYAHSESSGIAAALDGIVATTADDLLRIDRSMPLFDGLLARFGRRR